MANPFAQGDWDPFADLPAASKPQTPELPSRTSDHAAIRPARAAPPPPSANPFSGLGASSAQSGDPFAFLTGQHATTASSNGPASPALPSYEAAAEAPAPPSYTQAVDLPPPPAYNAAASMPPPPSYEAATSTAPAGFYAAVQPARPAPLAPTAAAHGPLHAGMPSRPAPAAPVPARPAPAAPVPARAAPSPPQPARAAPQPPAQAASAAITTDDLDWLGAAASSGSRRQTQQEQQHENVQRGLCDLQLSGAQSSSSSLSSSYLSTGNVGAVPRGAIGSSQQALQQTLHAQIRLPPLNAKAAPPLKTLAAGLVSLFASPAGDTGQMLQWAPRDSGSTLPTGAKQCPYEDHDSAECAELNPHKASPLGELGAAVGVSKPGKVSCMAVAPGPGWLWCGTTEGMVYCWSLGQSGGTAKLVHSWSAHSGKVKGIAVSPSGRLFTGSGNGAVKMWSYGSPAYADPGGPPRLLRQLKKVDYRTRVELNPHSKVVAVEVSSSGRVLWTVGKNTINLWSAHNGEHLGTLNDTAEDDYQDAFSGRGYASVSNTNDINPKNGLDVGRLNGLFERPAAELLADPEASAENEKDVKAMAMSAAVKGVGKASKVFNKFATKIASKLMDEGRQYSGESGDSAHAAYMAQSGAPSTSASAATAGQNTTEDKTNKWGSIKHLVAAGDASMWLSYKRGLLEKYSEGGQLLWSSNSSTAGSFKPSGITALAAIVSSIWVGDQAGRIWVLDAATGAMQRSWKAHVFPVRDITCGGHLVYSLSKDGGIRAWPALQPPQEVTVAWQEDLKRCLQEQQLKVLAGTWNVNETKPSRAGLQMWLGQQAKQAHVVMIGLQEVEMGTGSVALDVVYQNLAKSKLEAGTQAAQAWAAAVGEVLGTAGNFKRIGLRQMSGVLVLVFARAELEHHIGEVATASVACGVMGYGGNKGAVAISFSVFRRRVVIVSSHFAAHQEKVEARNADYAKIVRHLHFHNVPTDKPQQQQQYEASDVIVAGGNYISSSNTSSPARALQQQQTSIQGFIAKQQTAQQQNICQEFATDPAAAGAAAMYGSSPARSSGGRYAAASASPAAATADAAAAEDDWGAGMRDAELLVWVGDFNYRVDCPDGFVPDRSDPEKNPVSDQLYWFVHKKISAQRYLDLLSGDQCSRETSQGRIFHGLAEGPVTFMPTYKFEKGRESNKLQPFYDQGEKKRVPAWTDRIFFRGSGPQRSALQANPVEQPADIRVHLPQPQDYNSLMEVNDSDHKPVTAMLSVQLPYCQQQQLRSSSMDRLWQVANSSSSSSTSSDISPSGSASLLVEPQNVVLQGTFTPCGLLLSNPCRSCSCIFTVQGSGPGGALPPWLEVTPAAGFIAAGNTVQLKIQGSKAHWNSFGGSCELRVLACLEGSVDSSRWPMASYGYAQSVSVALP